MWDLAGDLFCTSPSEEQDWEGRMSRERRAGSDHILTKRSENFDKIRQRRRERAGCKMGKQFISRQWRWLMGVAPFTYHPFYLPAVGKMASCLYHHQHQNICNQKWLTEWVSAVSQWHCHLLSCPQALVWKAKNSLWWPHSTIDAVSGSFEEGIYIVSPENILLWRSVIWCSAPN